MILGRFVFFLVLATACGASEEPPVTSDGGQPATGDAAAGAGGGGSAGAAGGASAGGASMGGGSTSGTPAGGGQSDASNSHVADANASGSPGAGKDGGTSASTDAAGASPLEKFSFFATSLASLRKLSKSQNGFGGDLRYRETGDGAGLRGADKICTEIAELSMPGSSAKQWRAFLSTSKEAAKDRVGKGPWYDRQGRLVAQDMAGLIQERPAAHELIIEDLPNEFGVPNHDPDGTGPVDNHDFLTGSNAMGSLYCPSDPASCTCSDWTSSAKDNTKRPRVGHSWPRFKAADIGGVFGGLFGGGGGMPGGGMASGGDGSLNHWISALDEAGCGAGINLAEFDANGNPMPDLQNPVVGSGGGYGGFYCFALAP